MSSITTATAPKNPIPDWEKLRDEWLIRLSALVDSVQNWVQELGWSTRRIEIQMEDSQIGTYQAPALLMQERTTRLFLEPIARFAPGTEGVVDLYRMPKYDDIASLYFSNGGWQLQYVNPDLFDKAASRDIKSKPLNQETVTEILNEMSQHVP
jgi:hypothetical protein